MDRIFRLLILFFIALVGLMERGFSQTESVKAEEVEAARANPFLTQKEEKALVELGNALPLDYLKVSAIFYSAIVSQSRAIIDGKVLVLGDSIDNKEIIKINPEEVVLKDSQGRYVVKMAGLKANPSK